MADDLPNWVYDVVGDLLRHRYEHPKFFRWATGSGDTKTYIPADRCGCEALDLVPREVVDVAEVIRRYVAAARTTEPAEADLGCHHEPVQPEQP